MIHKWMANAWKWATEPRPQPKITLAGLRWNLEVRVVKSNDMRFGAGLKLSNSQCADVLAILDELEGEGK